MKTKCEVQMMIEAVKSGVATPIDWRAYAVANNRAQAAVLGNLVKWSDKDYLEYGCSMMFGWLTDKGREYFIAVINEYWLKQWLTDDDMTGLS